MCCSQVASAMLVVSRKKYPASQPIFAKQPTTHIIRMYAWIGWDSYGWTQGKVDDQRRNQLQCIIFSVQVMVATTAKKWPPAGASYEGSGKPYLRYRPTQTIAPRAVECTEHKASNGIPSYVQISPARKKTEQKNMIKDENTVVNGLFWSLPGRSLFDDSTRGQ